MMAKSQLDSSYILKLSEDDELRILVTGGSGFIGSNVVGLARSRSWDVENLDISPNSDINSDIRDIDWESIDLSRFDAVIHLAALISVPESFENPERYFQVNVEATERLFFHCVKNAVPKVIFSSSAAVYGSSKNERKIVGQESPPDSPYAETKLSGEKLAEKYSTSVTEFIAFRFFNVFGPGQSADSPYASVIPKFVRNLCSGKPVTIDGDGLQTRDFIHVMDVARAIISASEKRSGTPFEIINLGTGNGISIIELANLMKSIVQDLGGNGEPIISHGPKREGDVRDSTADIEGLDRFIPVESLSPLEQGIRDLISMEIS